MEAARVRALVWVWLLAGMLARGLDAQNLAPEAHWGGPIIPSDRPELRFGFHLNRFTEFSKTGTQYNEITETTGFQHFSLSWTENTPSDPDLFFTVTGGVGYSGDEPSNWLQNDYIHNIIHNLPVPVGDVYESVEYAAAGSLTKWWDGPMLFSEGEGPDEIGWHTRAFLGAGVSTSTIYHEAFTQVGGSLLIPNTFLGNRHVRVTVADRACWLTGGNAYPDIADFSNVAQLAIGLVPPRVESDNFVLQFLGNPEFGMSLSYDTGFFERAGEPIDTWFVGIYLQWATGLRFETWNDFANGSDFGPTYGLRVSFDLFTLFSNSRWRW